MSIIEGRLAEPGVLPYRYSSLCLDVEHFSDFCTSPEMQPVRHQRKLPNRYPVYRSQCLPSYPYTPRHGISPQRRDQPSLLLPLDPTSGMKLPKVRSMTMLVVTMATTTIAGLSLPLHADTTRMFCITLLAFLLRHPNQLRPGMARSMNHFPGL